MPLSPLAETAAQVYSVTRTGRAQRCYSARFGRLGDLKD